MKPDGAFQVPVDCDFSLYAAEQAVDAIRAVAKGQKVELVDTFYADVGVECDLLSVIDISRSLGMRPSFNADYSYDEWSIFGYDRKTLKHITVWSPGA